MSEVNEDKTYGDFREMGQRLAQEVISFMKRKMDKFSRTGRLRNIKLSFVGHSIGNVIIRAALVGKCSSSWILCYFPYVFFFNCSISCSVFIFPLHYSASD